jgi:hypothetical protein
MVFFQILFMRYMLLNDNMLIVFQAYAENMLKKMFSISGVYGKFFVLL